MISHDKINRYVLMLFYDLCPRCFLTCPFKIKILIKIFVTELSLTLLLVTFSKQLRVENDKMSRLKTRGFYHISRYPHYEEFQDSLTSSRADDIEDIDVNLMQKLAEDGGDIQDDDIEESDTLLDLPDDLQQLQQQLLEVIQLLKICQIKESTFPVRYSIREGFKK